MMEAGDYKVTVEVNDGDTTKESDELDITVSDDTEKPKELSISLSADKSGNQQVNTKIKFTAKVVGGSGDYNYTFKINDKKIKNGDSSTYTWTPKTSGEYTISVTVDDGKETKTSSKKIFNIVDEQNPQEGDNNSLYGLLLAGTFGATLLGALRRKRNM